MAQTLTFIITHVIFSTKDRKPIVPETCEPNLYAYIGGICRTRDSVLMAAGGTHDHVHLLVRLSKNHSLADLMLNIKRDSSKWMNDHVDSFRWQQGYAGLSVGRSQVDDVRRYLAIQKEHHRRVTFKEELLALLVTYEVEYDERYLWQRHGR